MFQMCTVSQMICVAILVCLSIVDIYCRKIPVSILALASIAVTLYQIIMKKEDIWLIVGGIGIGALFLLISRVTREDVGYGDSWAILVLGIYLGVWQLIEVLAAAFFLLAVVSIICMIRRKLSRKTAIPFYPFLAAGYLAILASGGLAA